jgi:predicted negative regulator of RcsB-dependent stress response
MNTLQQNAKKAGFAARKANLKRDPAFYKKIGMKGARKRWGKGVRSAGSPAAPKTLKTSTDAAAAITSKAKSTT